MATGHLTVAQSVTSAAVIGSGSGTGDLVLCSLSFGAQERAAHIRGLAWSSAGDRLEVDGVAAILPDDGISPDAGALLLEGHAALVLAANNTINLTVAGADGVTWRGWLVAELVYDYAA